MDIGKSISFVFEDEEWIQKLLIGGLITLASIVLSVTVVGGIIGIALIFGYMIEVIRNVRRGDPRPLPAWDQWGEKIIRGLKWLGLSVIWALPLIVVAIPAGILSSLGENSDTGWLFGLIASCFGCVAFLYGIFYWIIQPAYTIRLAETDEFASGLNFRDIFAFTREHIGEIIIALLVLLGVNLVAGIIGSLLCGVGLLFTSFWVYLVQGHLFGQIGRKSAGVDLSPVKPRYDISPDDIMPGVGELVKEVESGAKEGVAKVTDIGEGVSDAAQDVVDSLSDEPKPAS